jgi:hypothetical protein
MIYLVLIAELIVISVQVLRKRNIALIVLNHALIVIKQHVKNALNNAIHVKISHVKNALNSAEYAKNVHVEDVIQVKIIKHVFIVNKPHVLTALLYVNSVS